MDPLRKPIRRVESLQPLSREHHDGLLLSWKIRKGLSFNVTQSRIQGYITWFYENYLAPHFKIEEELVFPLLGSGHPDIEKALKQHDELRTIIKENSDLNKIADLLEEHIRFEERVLFNEIQNKAQEELNNLVIHEDPNTCGVWEDEFWK